VYRIWIVLVILLTACGSPTYLREGDAIDPRVGYALVRPEFVWGDKGVDAIDLWLARVDRDSMHEELYRSIPSGDLSILPLRPGFYYLDSIRALTGYFRFTVDGRHTLFEVKAGQVSYPGDWTIRVIFHSAATEGGAISGSSRVSYSVQLSTDPDPHIDRLFRARYPSVAAVLSSPVYTKVVAPETK
jgi:hypothetical protein